MSKDTKVSESDQAIADDACSRFNAMPYEHRNIAAMVEVVNKINYKRRQQKELRQEMATKMAKLGGEIGYLYQRLRQMDREEIPVPAQNPVDR